MKKIFIFLLAISNYMTVTAQWFHDNMESGVTTGSAPNPWVNNSASSPGVTNNGVTITGPGGTGYTYWNGGWDGVSPGGITTGASLTWQTDAGSPTTTSVSFTYSLTVTGTANISSMTFGTRRNSVGHPNIAVSINGTSYTPTTTTMSNTSFTPNSVTVSPALNFTTGQTITIVFYIAKITKTFMM